MVNSITQQVRPTKKTEKPQAGSKQHLFGGFCVFFFLCKSGPTKNSPWIFFNPHEFGCSHWKFEIFLNFRPGSFFGSDGKSPTFPKKRWEKLGKFLTWEHWRKLQSERLFELPGICIVTVTKRPKTSPCCFFFSVFLGPTQCKQCGGTGTVPWDKTVGSWKVGVKKRRELGWREFLNLPPGVCTYIYIIYIYIWIKFFACLISDFLFFCVGGWRICVRKSWPSSFGIWRSRGSRWNLGGKSHISQDNSCKFFGHEHLTSSRNLGKTLPDFFDKKNTLITFTKMMNLGGFLW